MFGVIQVIRLADCIRVTEVEMDGCPRDTGPFLVETTEKIYVFAADKQQLDDWTHRLCEIAFPVGAHTHTRACAAIGVSCMLTSLHANSMQVALVFLAHYDKE